MLAHCEDDSVISAEFYIMEMFNGIIPRKNLPRELQLCTSDTRKLCENALDSLIELHKVDYQRANLGHIAKGSGYTQRQINGCITRYQKARTWNVPKTNYICDWLKAKLPDNKHMCLTHNDFRFDNLVLDTQSPARFIGVLDGS